jgi:hypothetical protein
MPNPARLLATALLVAALAVPASLHASGLPDLRPAAAKHGATAPRSASPWSFDWLRHLLNKVLPLEGGGLDPSGGTNSVRPTPRSSVDTGGGLDPNGGS